MILPVTFVVCDNGCKRYDRYAERHGGVRIRGLKDTKYEEENYLF